MPWRFRLRTPWTPSFHNPLARFGDAYIPPRGPRNSAWASRRIGHSSAGSLVESSDDRNRECSGKSAVAKMTQTDSVSGARRPIDDPAPSVLAAEDASELIDASTTNIASVAVAGSALAVAIGGVAWGLLRRRSSGRG